MALGYEGYVKIGGVYALGTGASVPRVRSLMESTGAYGGKCKTPVSSIGIGAARNYDWVLFDGTTEFEVNSAMFTKLCTFVFDRCTKFEMFYSTRLENYQKFPDSFWKSIDITASEGTVTSCSMSFLGMDQDTPDYGVEGIQGYIQNREGEGVALGIPCTHLKTLNADGNMVPVPYWNTGIQIASEDYDFINWTLSFSQNVVARYSCDNQANPIEPSYVGIGPMSVKLSGSWMWIEDDKPSSFTYYDDTAATAKVTVGDKYINLAKLELASVGDNLQIGESLTPIDIEYNVYEIVNHG